MGWLFLYAGFSHITTPGWSAAGFLNGAKTFPAFFHALTAPQILPMVNLANEWALVLLGVSLIAGLFVKWSAPLGALLMLLYYLPGLSFPHVASGYLVDEHIVYIVALLYMAAAGAGKAWGLDGKFHS
jgi:thiosulfate dehydrogenase [quinone] large subunit